jgi:predicted nucleotidyltransferase component of viral defense system
LEEVVGVPEAELPAPAILQKDKQERLRRYLRALLYLFNVHTLFLGGMACLSVYICDRFRFSYNMDLTLVSTGRQLAQQQQQLHEEATAAGYSRAIARLAAYT